MFAVGGAAVGFASLRNYHLFLWIDRALLYVVPPAFILRVGRPKGLSEIMLALMGMTYMLIGGVVRYLDGLLCMPN